MRIGKILWWDAKDKNGLIKAEDGTKFYFDASVLKGVRQDKLKANSLVTFEVNAKVRDCLCAMNVQTPSAKAFKAVERKYYEAQQLGLGIGGVA